MITKLTIAVSLLLAFVVGFIVAQPDVDEIKLLSEEKTSFASRNAILTQRNTELEQTLDLVKRQIQTDRIAYSEMQKSVEDSDRQRQQTLQKLEAQRQLLDRLKKKLENL